MKSDLSKIHMYLPFSEKRVSVSASVTLFIKVFFFQTGNDNNLQQPHYSTTDKAAFCLEVDEMKQVRSNLCMTLFSYTKSGNFRLIRQKGY